MLVGRSGVENGVKMYFNNIASIPFLLLLRPPPFANVLNVIEDAYGDTPPPPGVRALRMTWPWMKAMRRGMQVAMETTKL